MRMKYISTLIVVKDIEKSKQFYHDVLEQEVVVDFGANVTLAGGFALQTSESWQEFIHKNEKEIIFGNHDAELYFEVENIEEYMKKLDGFNIQYVHPLQEHAWGQRVVRFYDLDKHIIEVGESLAEVVKRFIRSGLTAEETAARMNIAVEYVRHLIQ